MKGAKPAPKSYKSTRGKSVVKPTGGSSSESKKGKSKAPEETFGLVSFDVDHGLIGEVIYGTVNPSDVYVRHCDHNLLRGCKGVMVNKGLSLEDDVVGEMVAALDHKESSIDDNYRYGHEAGSVEHKNAVFRDFMTVFGKDEWRGARNLNGAPVSAVAIHTTVEEVEDRRSVLDAKEFGMMVVLIKSRKTTAHYCNDDLLRGLDGVVVSARESLTDDTVQRMVLKLDVHAAEKAFHVAQGREHELPKTGADPCERKGVEEEHYKPCVLSDFVTVFGITPRGGEVVTACMAFMLDAEIPPPRSWGKAREDLDAKLEAERKSGQ